MHCLSILVLACCLCLHLGAVMPVQAQPAQPQPAQAEENPRHVLILNSHGPDMPWAVAITQAVSETFAAHPQANVQLHIEYSGLAQNTDYTYGLNLVPFLSHKFRSRHPSLIIAVDLAAVRFLEEYGPTLFPDVPIVLSLNHSSFLDATKSPLMTGVFTVIDIPGTIPGGSSRMPAMPRSLAARIPAGDSLARKSSTLLAPKISLWRSST